MISGAICWHSRLFFFCRTNPSTSIADAASTVPVPAKKTRITRSNTKKKERNDAEISDVDSNVSFAFRNSF